MKGYSTEEISKFVRSLHSGITLQLMNAPLDMFVEKFIFETFPDFRPLQFLSLIEVEKNNLKSVQIGMSNTAFPPAIVNASKIMNIVTTMRMKELYGIDMLPQYKASQAELDEAELLLNTINDSECYAPGDEYGLVEYYVDHFQMADFVSIVNDLDLKPTQSDDVFELTPEEKKREEEFQKQHSQPNASRDSMMSFYMLGALEEFSTMSLPQIRQIAMDIAICGVNGISTEGNYSIPSLPNQTFGGYEFLAYYYVSWAIGMPDQLHVLNLPFATAYDIALNDYLTKGGKFPQC